MMVQRLLIVSVLCLGWLPAHAEIIRHWSADGRPIFTNIPVPPAPLLKESTRPHRDVYALGGQLRQLVQHLARQHDIEPRLVQAIVAVESNFNPQAVSHAGAQGLMQLMPSTAARYQVTNPFDPRANIEGGLRYLKDLFRL